MINSFYPVMCVDRPREVADFYIDHFAFTVTFEADWYVSLRREGTRAFELAVVDAAHPTVPEGYGLAVRGLLLNIEVPDVDAEWRRLVDGASLPVVLPIRSEGFGQRHFIVSDPAGVLVDVITEIEPAPEFASAFRA